MEDTRLSDEDWFESEQGNPEVDSIRDWKPVKLLQERCFVSSWFEARDDTCKGVLGSLYMMIWLTVSSSRNDECGKGRHVVEIWFWDGSDLWFKGHIVWTCSWYSISVRGFICVDRLVPDTPLNEPVLYVFSGIFNFWLVPRKLASWQLTWKGSEQASCGCMQVQALTSTQGMQVEASTLTRGVQVEALTSTLGVQVEACK